MSVMKTSELGQSLPRICDTLHVPKPAGPLSAKNWTRRSFVQSLGGIAAAAGVLVPFEWNVLAAKGAEAPGSSKPVAKDKQRYRAVSWWLTWDDLTWPNEALMEKIRRRADHCAANGVNCCIIFGAHFRWDFMPIWGRLHDLIRFIAEQLHQRQIMLFDHHSSVLTHRPRNQEEALNIWRRNRHHVPFYPSNEAAATLQFNGSRLNDWRMIDVETGQSAYLPAYNAEQYCMNHPAFREAYAQYLKQLRTETGIDGLMSDDGIFYADWRVCGCSHCRKRFKDQFGHSLPPVSDTEFWGNRRSPAFRDWIKMRFATCGDFLADAKQALPTGFPLLTCCSSSDGYAMPAFGMSYQDFIRNCNLVMLEMYGSTPSIQGTWDERIPSQLLHLGIARDHQAACLGLGYGFFPDTAFFVWALNKFLGSDSWFSTLKGRLGAAEKQLAALADDSELVGEGYRWEKAHPQLFAGEVDTDIAVFFSRATRDFYGQCQADYVGDYHASCEQLLSGGVTYEVVTEIPGVSKVRRLILSSATCLSAEQRQQLSEFLKGGGIVIATGPTGHYDEEANPSAKPWLQEFGIACELVEPPRSGGFPPYKDLIPPVKVAECRVRDSVLNQFQDGWFTVSVEKGRLYWRPERIAQKGVASAVIKVLRSGAKEDVVLKGLPANWQVRSYRDGNRLLIQALPAKVGTVMDPELRNAFTNQSIVAKLQYMPLTTELVLEPVGAWHQVLIHSPDLPESRAGIKSTSNTWVVDTTGIRRYFVLECLA
jgi:hypothetical protein